MKSNLLTPMIKRVMENYPLGSQDEVGADARVIVRYDGCEKTWLIIEGEELPNGDWLMFGFMNTGRTHPRDRRSLLWAWMIVRLSELESDPSIGRDLFLIPLESTVREEAYLCNSFS